MRARIALAAVLILTLAGVQDASAHRQVKSDPNDVLGPLDIAGAAVDHDRRNIYGYVETYALLRNGTIGPRNSNFLYVDFDTVGGSRADYFVALYYSRGMQAAVFRYTRGDARHVADVYAERLDDYSIYFEIPRRTIGAGTGIRWYASSFFEGCAGSYGLLECEIWDETRWFTH